ncbi:hypothetical protein [Helicobacter sp. WB40]|uniref:hypothetical protein n=1 Tax=Helicobacter sp. WB40 TaxID=3004130 RepID=UPI0022EBCBDA|nr:hypothetical protein [Helicobacter sp. WB40]MDA3968029.1 hypothetical protein [Helicobacter sp. WB40]
MHNIQALSRESISAFVIHITYNHATKIFGTKFILLSNNVDVKADFTIPMNSK